MRLNFLFRPLLPVLLLVSAAGSAFAAPRKSPELAIHIIGGTTIYLSQYSGKVVALAMILTTCPHCQATTRILSSLQKEFGPRGFQALGGAMSMQPEADIPKFIQDFSPAFPVGGVDYREAATYMNYGTERHYAPYLTFIDRKGMIQGQYDGKSAFNEETAQAKNIRDMVVKLLSEK